MSHSFVYPLNLSYQILFFVGEIEIIIIKTIFSEDTKLFQLVS